MDFEVYFDERTNGVNGFSEKISQKRYLCASLINRNDFSRRTYSRVWRDHTF